ncbi:hypothetical protein scyTo_0022168, partial [Scyliorhinus torazame]|nr:hypothetical protein [Scyliorhinus torazame]
MREPLKREESAAFGVPKSPRHLGVHAIDVAYNDSPVPNSPFRVPVTEGCDSSRVRAFGPGLDGGIANKPNKFTVETRNAGTGGLGLAVEGPSEAKITCKDNKDGSCLVEYVPYEPGTYDVIITYGGQQIRGSPFKVPVTDTVDPTKVKCLGQGLGNNVRANVPQSFTVDTSKAGAAPLNVSVVGPKGKPRKANIRDNHDGTYTVSYIPAMTGRYTILIKYGGDEIPYSPYRVRALPTGDASKCTVTVSIGGHGL